MYPDPEHFYEDSVSDHHCLDFTEDEEFLKCLKTVSVDDIQNPKFKDCQYNRFKKCREENGTANILKRHLTRTRPIKCDKLNIVYSLTKDESNFLKPYDECSRPFIVHKIPHSNLILLVTNRLCAQVFATEREFDNVPETIPYINSTFCRRMKVPQLYRGRPSYCTNFHTMVNNKIFPKKIKN